MPRKRVLITAGLIAVAGATAVMAQGYRGHGGPGGPGGDREFGERHSGRWGWHRSVSKADYDAKTRSRFAAMDANSDGVVDATEAKALIERRMEKRRSRWRHRRGARRFERVIARFDTDNDGKVTKAEFDARIEKMFARMDLDGDGRITDADLPPMMRGRDILKGNHFRGRRGPGRFLRFVRGADTNGDGVITKEEAMAVAAKRFARFDRNGDGVVDKADIEALKVEMMDYRVKRFFHRYGAAKDGKLTLEQYTKFRGDRFAQLDRNKDGVLARDEMRGRWGGFSRRGRGGEHHWGRGWRHYGGDRRGPMMDGGRGPDSDGGPQGERRL